MDESHQVSNPNPQASNQVVPPIPPPAPSMPVGSMHKEAGPTVVEQPVVEVLQPSEKVPVLSPEVVEAGVEVSKNHEVPDLTLHDKNAGISHAPVIAPIPTGPTGLVDIDTTQEQALAQVKESKSPKESKSWLAIEVLKMVQRKLLGGEH